MVIRTEVTVNGGGVDALSRDASMFDSAGNILRARRNEVIDGSRVSTRKRKHDSADIELAWNPLEGIDGPRDIVEKRAVAALLLSLRSARS